MIKAKRKQSAKDKALNKAAFESQAAGAPSGGRTPRAKAKAKAKGSGKAKTLAPHGTCFEYWEHEKCSTRDLGQVCKWDHVKSTSPEAAGYIARAKAAADKKAQAAPANGTTPKPKSKMARKYFKLGKCEKGKSCEHSRAGGAAAPVADLNKEQKGARARKATTCAAAVEQTEAAVGAGPATMYADSDSS